MAAALHVLGCLYYSRHIGLVVRGKTLSLVGYSNLDWAKKLHDRTSTSGYLFWLADGVIPWKLRKQRTTALCSTKAKYMALSDAETEAMWLRQTLQEIGFLAPLPTPIS